jgi:serine/threonine protein kinase
LCASQTGSRALARREIGIVAARRLQLEAGAEPYPGCKLVRLIGQGGCGCVWVAQRADGKQCALKFLACQNDTGPAQEIRAINAIRQLQHPNLMPINCVWTCPGYLVIAMDLADGSLVDLLEVYQNELEQAMALDHVVFFLRQAADAIDFLNTRQHLLNQQRVALRHCDIKPSNLLVIGQKVFLADFGLSVQASAAMWYHRKAGTVAYSAPEVFQGWLSERSDQYSLAVTYFQLRTGRFPFQGTPSTFQLGYVRPDPDLSLLQGDERQALARALAPTPQDRYSSCREMMEQLAQCGRPALMTTAR